MKDKPFSAFLAARREAYSEGNRVIRSTSGSFFKAVVSFFITLRLSCAAGVTGFVRFIPGSSAHSTSANRLLLDGAMNPALFTVELWPRRRCSWVEDRVCVLWQSSKKYQSHFCSVFLVPKRSSFPRRERRNLPCQACGCQVCDCQLSSVDIEVLRTETTTLGLQSQPQFTPFTATFHCFYNRLDLVQCRHMIS